jgi:hypothetical protein
MEMSDPIQTTLTLASLFDCMLCLGIISALGLFLWSKGRETLPPKR